MSKLIRLVKIFVSLKYKFLLGSFGQKSIIDAPLKIGGKKNIYIGKNVLINCNSWVEAKSFTGEIPRLIIDSGTIVGHFAHIFASKLVHIEKDVLIADKVYISDCLHGYQDVFFAVKDQEIVFKDSVVIGAGAWLGENVCVVGASVGKNTVIGAGAVVTHDIPDYCVAVGVPAKVIKKYNFASCKWEDCDDE